MNLNRIMMTEFNTPLGPMLACATDKGVCLLEFTNRVKLEKELNELKVLLKAEIETGENNHLAQLNTELKEYFEGQRKVFSVSLDTPGNEFSQSVWRTLQEIPYGKTLTYKEQADKMNHPKAIRAIAATNGRNRLAIVIPCHRVIGSNGSMTGYAAGIDKKKWLLKFERANTDIPAGSLF